MDFAIVLFCAVLFCYIPLFRIDFVYKLPLYYIISTKNYNI